MSYTHRIFYLLSAFFISSLICHSEEPRTWLLEDGTTFKATFKKFKRGSVALENEAGKTTTFPVSKLSIVDRHYLHTEQELPLEELEGGNYLKAELKLKLNRSDIKELPKYRYAVGDDHIEFSIIQTPHFLFFVDKGAKEKEYIENTEKLWFSMAYRFPGFLKTWGEKRRGFFLVKQEDTHEHLGVVYLASIKDRVTERQYNQARVNWGGNQGMPNLPIPQELVEKYNTEETGRLHMMNYDRDRLETLPYHFIKHIFRAYYKPGHIKHTGESRNNPDWFYSLVQNIPVVIQIFGDDQAGFGGTADNTNSQGIGGYGETEKWADQLAEDVEEGLIDPSFSLIKNHPKNDKDATSRENYRRFGMVLVACGRFMQQDLKHMINYSSYSQFLEENKRYPTHEEIAEIFQYEGTEELDAALKEFILEDNADL